MLDFPRDILFLTFAYFQAEMFSIISSSFLRWVLPQRSSSFVGLTTQQTPPVGTGQQLRFIGHVWLGCTGDDQFLMTILEMNHAPSSSLRWRATSCTTPKNNAWMILEWTDTFNSLRKERHATCGQPQNEALFLTLNHRNSMMTQILTSIFWYILQMGGSNTN